MSSLKNVSNPFSSLFETVNSFNKVIDWYGSNLVQGQHVEDSRLFSVKDSTCSCNGSLNFKDNSIVIDFPPGQTACILSIKLDRLFLGNGLGVIVKLMNWGRIRYAALGYTFNGQYRHIKINNPILDEKVLLEFSHHDLSYLLQNEYFSPGLAIIEDIRIYVRVAENEKVGSLEIFDCAVWNVSRDLFSKTPHGRNDLLPKKNIPSELEALICNYLIGYFPSYEEQVNSFFNFGKTPLKSNVNLDWALNDMVPGQLMSNNTYRYSWHAQHPAIMLFLMFKKTNELSYLLEARSFIDSWLDNNFFKQSDDNKYAWYDHGVAERLLAFILIYNSSLSCKFSIRFYSRLSMAIHSHAMLLANESFYVSDQPYRHHNHALFQDIALMSVAAAFRDLPCSEYWADLAHWRFSDQVDKLIAEDGEYAVCVENSIGYHRGARELIRFAGQILNFSNKGEFLRSLSEKLDLFTKAMEYSNSQLPAQGDTFTQLNNKVVNRSSAVPSTMFKVLSKVGYGIVKGLHDGIPYDFNLYCTSLSPTHKHDDNLSFTLFYDDVEWFTDPSFFSHEYDKEIPKYLRSAFAHNCLAVNGIDYKFSVGNASIVGEIYGDDFSLNCHHNAYERCLVKRRVKGSLNALDLSFHDSITTTSELDSCKLSAQLMFQCGPGVEVNKSDNSQSIELSHPKSKYIVSLGLSSNDSSFYFGKNEQGLVRGIMGLGFMEQINIFTAAIDIPFDKEINWRLRILKR